MSDTLREKVRAEIDASDVEFMGRMDSETLAEIIHALYAPHLAQPLSEEPYGWLVTFHLTGEVNFLSPDDRNAAERLEHYLKHDKVVPVYRRPRSLSEEEREAVETRLQFENEQWAIQARRGERWRYGDHIIRYRLLSKPEGGEG